MLIKKVAKRYHSPRGKQIISGTAGRKGRIKMYDIQELKKVRLASKVSDMLIEFSELNKDDFTTSDFQGIAMAKAMAIIKLVENN